MKFLKLLLYWTKALLSGEMGVSASDTSTLAEAIPTAVASALLEAQELDIVLPLVTQISFPGAGYVHNTPFIAKLTAEHDQSLADQEIDSGAYKAASAATVENTGSTVFLKELAVLATVDDLMAIAGQLIGRSIATYRDTALCTLFTSFTQNEGAANTQIKVQDIFDAYNFLRTKCAPQPYNLVLDPGQIWSSKGIMTMTAATADADHYPYLLAGAQGTVGDDIARNAFAGRMFGFDVYADANVITTSRDTTGGAFSREAIKYVAKRPFRIDVLYDGPKVGWQVTGTEFYGAAVLRDDFGDEMLFLNAA